MIRLPAQIFSGLINLAQELASQGRPVINLGQGNPDQPTPRRVVRALQEAAENPRYQRYIPFTGLPELKQAAARWYFQRYGVDLDWQHEIAILVGSKIGLQEISLTLLNPGDRALIPDPGYPDYWSGIRLAGAQAVPWTLNCDTGLPDIDELDSTVRLAFLNYPGNPTGKLAPAEFFDSLIAKAQQTGTTLAHDLAYGDIVFDGRKAVSLLSRPGGKRSGVEFTTLSKSYNMAGFRLGFAAGNAELIGYLETLQDHLSCSQYGAIQEAAAAALSGPPKEVDALRRLYQSRRDTFIAALAESGWMVPPAEGSIFQWIRLPDSCGASAPFAYALARQHALIVAPGVGFGLHGEGFIRVSLTADGSVLAEGARLLGQFRQAQDRA
jgi:aminotransferase